MKKSDQFIDENAAAIYEANKRLAISLANDLLNKCDTYQEASRVTYKMEQTYPSQHSGPSSHLNSVPGCVAAMAGDLIRKRAQAEKIPKSVKQEGVELDEDE